MSSLASLTPDPDEPARAGARLATDTSLYTLGIAVTRLANLLLLPLYLSRLSKEEYGALGLLEQVVQTLVMLTMAGGLEALLKIGIELRETPEQQQRLVSTMTTWMLVAGVGTGAACALLWPWIGGWLGGLPLWPTGVYALSGVAGAAAFQTLSAHLQVTDEVKKHTLYSAIRTLLNVSIAVPLLLLTDLGVDALLLAGAVSFWLGTLLLVVKMRRTFRLGIDWSLLKRTLSYGVPLLPHLAASIIFQATDKFMLAASATHGLEAVAVYSVGSRISSGVMMLGLGMQRAWLPYFFQEAGRDDDDGWRRVRRLSFWSMAAMAAAVASLGLLAPELVGLIAPSSYATAAAVTAVLCLSTLLRTGAQVSSAVVLHSSTAYRIWFASLPAAIINVVLNSLFIPEYGALGAAWSTTAAMALNLLFTVLLARRVRLVPFRYGPIALIIVVVVALVVVAAPAPLVARIALCAVVPLVAVALDWSFAVAEVRKVLQKVQGRE